MSIKCYYHSADLDGHCSGAIVKYKFPDAELFGINYGQPFPFDKISKDDTVIMVDFSLQPFSEMVKLTDIIGFDNFIWIDHHQTAINDANNYDMTDPDIHYEDPSIHISFSDMCDGFRSTAFAACELTWLHFFEDRNIPDGVHYLGRYDVWDHRNDNVLPFQFGFRLNDTDPDNQYLWRRVFDDYNLDHLESIIAQTINDGITVLKYQTQENAKYCNSCAFEVNFEGHKAIAINKMLTNSQLFDSVWDESKYNFMIAFGRREAGNWTVSLYTTKPDIDVSAICKKLGGGGHKKAAGFTCSTLPF